MPRSCPAPSPLPSPRPPFSSPPRLFSYRPPPSVRPSPPSFDLRAHLPPIRIQSNLALVKPTKTPIHQHICVTRVGVLPERTTNGESLQCDRSTFYRVRCGAVRCLPKLRRNQKPKPKNQKPKTTRRNKVRGVQLGVRPRDGVRPQDGRPH